MNLACPIFQDVAIDYITVIVNGDLMFLMNYNMFLYKFCCSSTGVTIGFSPANYTFTEMEESENVTLSVMVLDGELHVNRSVDVTVNILGHSPNAVINGENVTKINFSYL